MTYYLANPEDLKAAADVIQLQSARMRRAIAENNWDNVSRSLRVIAEEADHARTIARTLLKEDQLSKKTKH